VFEEIEGPTVKKKEKTKCQGPLIKFSLSIFKTVTYAFSPKFLKKVQKNTKNYF
jgi:hypothetical protein